MSGSDRDSAVAAALSRAPGNDPGASGCPARRPQPRVRPGTPSGPGTHPQDPRHRFTQAARATDLEEVGERYARAGVASCCPVGPAIPWPWPATPGHRPCCSPEGDPSVVDGRPRVAIVGTRSPTPYGLQVASDMAADLADAGVVVVVGSGHRDRRRGPRRSGPTVPVPRPAPPVCGGRYRPGRSRTRPRTTRLWAEVASTGVGLLRGRARDTTASPGLPGPEPDHRRPVRRGGGRREPPRGGSTVHRRGGGPSVHPGMCGARVGAEPAPRTAPTSSCSTDATPVRDATDVHGGGVPRPGIRRARWIQWVRSGPGTAPHDGPIRRSAGGFADPASVLAPSTALPPHWSPS